MKQVKQWTACETHGRAAAFPGGPQSIELPGPLRSYDVSVVVPTYNRQLLLTRTLESLRRQRAGSIRFEVVVVDNNSTDDTRAVVSAFTGSSADVRYFFEPRRGVSHARNTGIAAARAPIVAFIDDDVEANPAWIATIKHTFDTHPQIDCVGGKIEARWAAPPPPWLTPMFWGAIALQEDKAETPYLDADHAVPCLMTANFACRRAALEEVGGFSADYLRDEDRELQLRLWSAGKRGLYFGAMVVTTEVPIERLTKRYHRRFYIQAGTSHARMRYLDRIDVNGRLIREVPRHATLLGTPGFIYRRLFFHAAGLIWRVVRLNRSLAFYHQTRLIYFACYIWTRCRQERRSLWAIPLEFARFVTATFLNRRRARAAVARAPQSAM